MSKFLETVEIDVGQVESDLSLLKSMVEKNRLHNTLTVVNALDAPVVSIFGECEHKLAVKKYLYLYLVRHYSLEKALTKAYLVGNASELMGSIITPRVLGRLLEEVNSSYEALSR